LIVGKKAWIELRNLRLTDRKLLLEASRHCSFFTTIYRNFLVNRKKIWGNEGLISVPYGIMTFLHPLDKSHPTKVEHRRLYVASSATVSFIRFTLNNKQKKDLP
jgi:hypothetical protein